jgi:hypothetical protein
VKALGPQVLVVAGQRRAILREHEADAVAPHEIGVGQVLDDLADRPLARRLRLRKPGIRQAGDRAPNRVRLCVPARRWGRASRADPESPRCIPALARPSATPRS